MDSLKPSPSKLPIKRKTPHHSNNFLSPKQQEHDQSITTTNLEFNPPPPFKFHRIWTEPDEIRFLQGLLDSASLGLSFPRDLSLFYENFSNSMSQPYTKYQLSEKLRRLRKKYRVTSSRVSRGLNFSLLSSHDRNLYHLSMKLWSPEYLPTSPFGTNSLVGLQSCSSNFENDNVESDVDLSFDSGGQQEKVLEEEMRQKRSDFGLGEVVARTALDAFDESLTEVKQGVFCTYYSSGLADGEVKDRDFERRWKQQRFEEFDVLTRRLRLVLENSFNG